MDITVKSTMTETCSAVLRSRRNCSSDMNPLADLGFFLEGDDFGNPSERSIEGVWAYGRMKFERL